jgi:hypothetical protein
VLSHTEIISFFSLDKIDTGLHPPPIYIYIYIGSYHHGGSKIGQVTDSHLEKEEKLKKGRRKGRKKEKKRKKSQKRKKIL